MKIVSQTRCQMISPSSSHPEPDGSRWEEPAPPERSCGKVRYADLATASADLARITKLPKGRSRPYKPKRAYECEDCGGTHLTSQGWERKKKAKRRAAAGGPLPTPLSPTASISEKRRQKADEVLARALLMREESILRQNQAHSLARSA